MPRGRGWYGGVALVAPSVVVLIAVTRVGAQLDPVPDPTVTISGPSSLVHGARPCSDASLVGRAEIVIQASAPPTAGTEVGISTGGDAVSGEDYWGLPTSAALDDAGRATFTLQMMDGPAARRTLQIFLEEGDGYDLGQPSSLTVELTRYDGRCAPPTYTDAPTNTAQNVRTGDRLTPLQAVPFEDHRMYFELTSGELPPGVDLLEDGTFAGIARAAGTFMSVVDACTPVFGRLCSSTQLTVTVTGEPTVLARTG